MVVGGEGQVEGVEEGSTAVRRGGLSREKSRGDGEGKDEVDVKGSEERRSEMSCGGVRLMRWV